MTPRQALLREVFARHSTPFAYGGAECVALARDAYETLTGRALALPTWNTELEAKGVIARHGTLQDAVTAYLGTPRMGVPDDGDVVLACMPSGVALLGVWANGRPVARGGRGVVPLPASWMVCFWRTE